VVVVFVCDGIVNCDRTTHAGTPSFSRDTGGIESNPLSHAPAYRCLANGAAIVARDRPPSSSHHGGHTHLRPREEDPLQGRLAAANLHRTNKNSVDENLTSQNFLRIIKLFLMRHLNLCVGGSGRRFRIMCGIFYVTPSDVTQQTNDRSENIGVVVGVAR
jgi:hypothetical protein